MNKSKTSVLNDLGFDDWVKNTRIFRQWEDTQREIQLHKWYRSEEAGHDIGWERASVDWMIHHGCKSEKNQS
jgi:hypothetical protein